MRRIRDEVDTKLCRATGCRRTINRARIFCPTHFAMLTPPRQQPIDGNSEAVGNDINAARRVSAGAADAVAYIARIEGRRTQRQIAINRAVTEQTSGGSSNYAPSSTYSDSTTTFSGGTVDRDGGTTKLQEL